MIIATNREKLYSSSHGPISFYEDEVLISHLPSFSKPPLVFIHGFNNTFDKSFVTAKDIQAGVPDHQVILFSWYSDGHIWDYEQDRAHARGSVSDFQILLKMLGPKVKVIAHSMGNYVVQLSLETQAPQPIDRLIMVAADVNNTCLHDAAFSTLVGLGSSFFCAEDGALDGSSVLHLIELNGLPRLGCTGAVPPGSLPTNFKQFNYSGKLIGDLNPIDRHSHYFVMPEFYKDVNSCLL